LAASIKSNNQITWYSKPQNSTTLSVTRSYVISAVDVASLKDTVDNTAVLRNT